MPSSPLLLDDNALPRDFAIFQRFNRQEDLEEVVEVLRDHQILVHASTEDSGEWRETTIIGSPLQPKFWLEIPASQFEKANFVLQEHAEETLSEEDILAHPFATYSRSELEQVLLEETDWNPTAVVIARKLLLRQGYDVDLPELRKAARQKLAEDYAPQPGNKLVIVLSALAGCFAALSLWIVLIMVTLGVLLYYLAGTRRDPKGVKHWAYDYPTRQLGRIAVAAMALCLLAGLLNFFWLGWVAFPVIDSWYWIWR